MFSRDLADSSLASYTPDIAAEIDGLDPDVAELVAEARTEGIDRTICLLLDTKRAGLEIDCLAIATGAAYRDDKTMASIARSWGLTRAAISQRCVDLCQRLGIPPSRFMRSEMARQTFALTNRRNLSAA